MKSELGISPLRSPPPHPPSAVGPPEAPRPSQSTSWKPLGQNV